MNAIGVFARAVLVIAALALAGTASSAAESPEALVQSTSDEIVGLIARTQDRSQFLEAVKTKVVPHFNFEHMTELALGPSWKQGTPEQRQAVVAAFRTLLIRTYSNAFAAAKQRNATVTVSPPQGGSAGKTEVTVRSKVTPRGGQPISLVYEMELVGSKWQVYDVLVDSVSLVTNYRETFASEIKKGGFEGLIKTLDEKNRATTAANQNPKR